MPVKHGEVMKERDVWIWVTEFKVLEVPKCVR